MRVEQIIDLAVEHNLAPSNYFWEWDFYAQWQFRFLVKKVGLSTDAQFLDIGCGAMRLGYLLVPYLEDDHYCGIDAFQQFIDFGHELMTHIGNKRKYSLLCSSDFEFGEFGRRFDVAFAQSVLGHLSHEQNRQCLRNLKSVMNEGGKFYATVSLAGRGKSSAGIFYNGILPFSRPMFRDLDFLRQEAEALNIGFEELDRDHHAQRVVMFSF